MPNSTADRNLLFGILALQLDFIGREELIAAMNAWVLEKSKPLGVVLVEQGKLSADRQRLLDTLVSEHLKQHGNDTEKSLAAMPAIQSVRRDLGRIRDRDVEASLIHVTQIDLSDDPNATQTESVGASTSAGTRFRVLRPHARGGLGQVSVALDEELNREVALKELQDHHADDPFSRSRFILEAEITGGLEHPGVVPVYGLGKYADGRPFYAMRFIRGESLKDAIDQFHLRDSGRAMDRTVAGNGDDLRGAGDVLSDSAAWRNEGERTVEFRKLLGRFIDVCQAIDYAHSRGVLHRDLKPGNIMLGKYGETLVVDWGLAKSVERPESHRSSGESTLAPRSGSGSTPTQAGAAIGTPAFMSPEQAAGRLEDLGPRSDVYSLGATLYCLLTGRAPISESDIGSTLRKVQNGEFPAPRQVKPDVAPALNAVCLRAMARDPDKRYASPSELAEDIEHWLANEPVSAYPEPYFVRVRRWVHRHETTVGVAAAAILVAGVGLAVHVSVISERNHRLETANRAAETARVEAEEQRSLAVVAAREAQVEATRAINISNFLQGMFEAADPIGIKGWKLGMTNTTRQDLTAREVLDRGAASVEERLRDEPLVQAALMNIIGNCYTNLALKDKATPLLQRSLELRRQTLGEDHLEVADSLHNFAWLRHQLGEYPEAEALYRRAIEVRKQNLGDQDLLVGETKLHLAWLLADTGAYEESENLIREVIELRKRVLGENDRQVAVALSALAGLCFQRGDDDIKVLGIVQQSQQIYAAQEGDTKFSDATVAFQMGLFQTRLGNFDGAEQQYRRALDLGVQVLGEGHPYVGFVTHELASVLRRKGQYEEAEALQRKTIDVCLQILPKEHPKRVLVLQGLGLILQEKGDLPGAKQVYLECASLLEKWISSHPLTFNMQRDLAEIYSYAAKLCRKQGDFTEALAHGEKALEISRQLVDAFPSQKAQLYLADEHTSLALIQSAALRPRAALENHLRALEINKPAADAKLTDRDLQFDVADGYNNLVHTSIQLGLIPDALAYCRHQLDVLEKLNEAKPNDRRTQRDLGYANVQLGDIAIQQGRLQQAAHNFSSALDWFSKAPSKNESEANTRQRDLAVAHRRLGLAFQENLRFDKAIESFQREHEIVERLESSKHLHGTDQGWPARAKSRIAICQKAEQGTKDLDFTLAQPRLHAVRLLEMRAGMFAETGRYAEATESAERLRDIDAANPRYLYEVACCFAYCSRAVGRSLVAESLYINNDSDAKRSLTLEEQAARAQYQKESIRYLTAALDGGWAHSDGITELELAPIRHLPEFESIAERIRSSVIKTGSSADAPASNP
jgi:serine/threonine protein kinase/tetratricopeptide (TPR) repeat protein